MKEYYSEKTTYEKISRDRLTSVAALVPARRPLAILDIGCGAGGMGAYLKKDKSISVFGTDVSKAAVEEARKNLDGAFQMDLEHPTDWPPEITERRFDVVILSEVLEHLFFPERALSAIKPLLGEDGSVIITVPNILFWKNRLRIFAGHFEYADTGLMDRGHIHFFSWKSFRDMLREQGFEITGIAHHAPTRIFRPLVRFFPGLFAFQFIVRAELKS